MERTKRRTCLEIDRTMAFLGRRSRQAIRQTTETRRSWKAIALGLAHCPRCVLVLVLACLSSTLAAAERTVVLTNGSVIRGEVRQTAKQVIVRTSTAELRFAVSDVEMVCRNLRSAYESKADSTTDRRPTSREALVLWCLRTGLHQQATRELETLRQRWPEYERLDLLANQIRSFRGDAKGTVLPSRVAQHKDTQFAEDHLDRLSKSTISEFVRHVQPLMMNRCGQANCHGKATPTSFALVGSPRSTVPTGLTHRNLGATLQKLNGPAAQTLLWMSANSPHGEMQKKPMAPPELQRLHAWIARACDELGVADHSGVVQASAETPLNDSVDPFDPAEFNRKRTNGVRPGLGLMVGADGK